VTVVAALLARLRAVVFVARTFARLFPFSAVNVPAAGVVAPTVAPLIVPPVIAAAVVACAIVA
jgi:hypothetical protein